jgi:hypothetical protein
MIFKKPKSVSAIDWDFKLKYGLYPDQYYLRERKSGKSADDVSADLQFKIHGIWLEQKAAHDRECAQSDSVFASAAP